MDTLIKYFKQPSTWRGLIAVVTAFGVSINPDQITAIVGLGVAAVGVVEVFRNEDNK